MFQLQQYGEFTVMSKLANESFRFPPGNHIVSIKTSKVHKQNSGGHISDLPNDIRFDGIGHMRQSTTQGRCKVCQKNARVMCAKCENVVSLEFRQEQCLF